MRKWKMRLMTVDEVWRLISSQPRNVGGLGAKPLVDFDRGLVAAHTDEARWALRSLHGFKFEVALQFLKMEKNVNA